MQAIIVALLDLIRPYIQTFGAVLSTILIKDSWRDAEREQQKSESLQARLGVEKRVSDMSDADIGKLLDDEWDSPKKRVRRVVPNLQKR